MDLGQINPIFFDKPYYLEPLKGGAAAYGLLRDVLADTNKVGIAKVAMRGRQHLAALKANGPLLVLELMHFPSEISPTEDVKVPEAKAGAREKEMARALIEQMTAKWKPENYNDEYATAVMKLIDKKVAAGGKELPGSKKRGAPAATNVVDLVAVLQQSLHESGRNARAPKRQPPKRAGKRGPASKRVTHKRAA